MGIQPRNPIISGSKAPTSPFRLQVSSLRLGRLPCASRAPSLWQGTWKLDQTGGRLVDYSKPEMFLLRDVFVLQVFQAGLFSRVCQIGF